LTRGAIVAVNDISTSLLLQEWLADLNVKQRLCEYRTWHTLEGLAAYALLLTAQPELAETQRLIANGLKIFAEKSRAKTF
jgi:hypothetical protein